MRILWGSDEQKGDKENSVTRPHDAQHLSPTIIYNILGNHAAEIALNSLSMQSGTLFYFLYAAYAPLFVGVIEKPKF